MSFFFFFLKDCFAFLSLLKSIMKYFARLFAEENDHQIAERPEKAHEEPGQNGEQKL